MIFIKVLALDLGGTSIKSAIVEDGRLFEPKEHPSYGYLGGDKLLENAFLVARQYDGYDCIGISTTGQVNISNGCIRYANNNVPNYSGTPVGKLFQEAFNVPVSVLNDANAVALGEAVYGAGNKFPDFICLTYGTGVGGAIIINKQINSGGFGVAGEFGHIVSHFNGLSCVCGQRGCYEQYASTNALVKMAMKEDPDCINGKIIFKKMQEGNLTIKKIVDNWIDEILLGLRSLIHIFNPACIVMGGGIMKEDYILDSINSKIYGYLNPGHRGVRVVKAILGGYAGLLGASVFATNSIGGF